MKNKVKKRIFYFDELRALAILFVILCHTTTIYKPFHFDSLIPAIPGILNMLGWVGVPLFFMISGALLLNRQYTLKDFFKKRFSRILYPFIFWMIITLSLEYFILGYKTSLLYAVFFGDSRYTWFLWVMMGIYLFLPAINSFIREYGLKGCEYFLAIWFITILISTFGFNPFTKLDLTYFAGFIGFPILGYYLNNKKFNISEKKLIILGILLYVVFVAINWYCQGHELFISESAYLSVSVVLASCGVFLCFKNISDYSQKSPESLTGRIHNFVEKSLLGKIILSISMCSFGMYFVNSLLMAFIKSTGKVPAKQIPLLFLSVVIMSWLIIFILDKIPGLKKIIGT